MTKAEFVQAIAGLPDDAQILIEAWPDTGNQKADLAACPIPGELYPIREAELIPEEGRNAAFVTLKADTRPQRTPSR
jgi:hypothetical protein